MQACVQEPCLAAALTSICALNTAMCRLSFLLPAGNASLATEWFHKLGYSIQMGVSALRGAFRRARIACLVVWQSLTASTSSSAIPKS